MLAACLRYLSRREYGRAELRQKLLSRGYPEPLVDEVVADAVREGLQSDARFAESFVRGRVGKGYGSARIQRELRQRGIEDAPDLKEWDWEAQIDQVYRKKYGDTLPDGWPERASRERFLLGRGFGHDDIRQLFRRLARGGTD